MLWPLINVKISFQLSVRLDITLSTWMIMLHITLKGMKRKANASKILYNNDITCTFKLLRVTPSNNPASANKRSTNLHCFRYVSSLVGYHALTVMLLHYIV